MPVTNRKAWVVAQWLFAAALVWFAVRALGGQWGEVAAGIRGLRPNWLLIAAASAVTLVAYALLIEGWRRLIAAAGERLAWRDASLIWLAGNLGKYVPGKVWSIIAMSGMAAERGVSPATAAGSSVVMQIVTIAAGAVVVAASGGAIPGGPVAAALLVIVIVAALLALPVVIPRVLSFAGKRAESVKVPPRKTLWLTIVIAAAAWVLLSVGFMLFVRATLPALGGSVLAYVSAYTASYIAGFIAPFAPGGIGVREPALVIAMTELELATTADAAVIAVASRLWLTVVELVPGLIALAVHFSKRKTN
ncbi:MAG TPA: lysylphosphatidylglycerol synthase domain-containing protein [Gemmatimonadaceae bacterium]|nr:lysylphosphatidylglycerol synthase domain-containing protein [Gemmatimonadaceae bacterium]